MSQLRLFLGIDSFFCLCENPVVNDLEIIADPLTAIVALDPVRARLLADLAEPASAGALATRLGIARQKIHYHLKALETAGLVREVQRRQWGGLTERRLQATASGYLVSPDAMGPAAPAARPSATLLATAARLLRDAATLLGLSRASGKRVAAMVLEEEVWFHTPEERDAFQDELSSTVRALADTYREALAPGARKHRLVVAVHPDAGSGT